MVVAIATPIRRSGISSPIRGFVWNATNRSRDRRTQLVDLLAAYNVRARIVYV
jgi:hypothetical protein